MSGRDDSTAGVGTQGTLSAGAHDLYLAVIRTHGRIARKEVAESEYSYLSELLDIGLLVPDTDDPHVLLAADPQQLSSGLSATWQRQALELLARAIAIPGDLQGLADAFHNPDATGGTVEYVRGKAIINQRINHAVASAKEEVLAAQPGGPRPPEVLSQTLAEDIEDLRRGISARTIYHPSTRYHAPTRDYVATLTEAGGRFRTLDEPYTRLIIVDRALAVIPVAEDLNLAAFIHDPAVIHFLTHEVFERNWNRGLDFSGGRTVPQQVVSRMRQTIIDLLLDGTNHRVIARRLGISERTLARHLAEMREDYNVESLFQLGYALARSSRESHQGPANPAAPGGG
ncbi:helix-turn-helix domain-containing protein [Kitasatospora sp. CM 4170]|uniref:Helix-turn-helix domain-containing protein n=1 Tax=Kitasatospora aburaviensis TaxID=67265 RepID=A0ABW1EZC3_9ACTN|nr:helix-turn-helix domain-containing protein [Kitasatospora sp. CM 4170]WNM46751.1 helix-turn-helix domain-containing protein [Kitasatospora sp. CM 4170]